METQFLRLLVDQFGKFQKISSWFDPENPLMDVRNDSGRVTLLNDDDDDDDNGGEDDGKDGGKDADKD